MQGARTQTRNKNRTDIYNGQNNGRDGVGIKKVMINETRCLSPNFFVTFPSYCCPINENVAFCQTVALCTAVASVEHRNRQFHRQAVEARMSTKASYCHGAPDE